MHQLSTLSWLKSTLIPPGRRVVTIRSGLLAGLRMELDPSHQFQLELGLYERETQDFVRRLAQGIDYGVDVGAGEGEHTLFLLAKTNATVVVAVEPRQDLAERVLANCQLNGLASERLAIQTLYVGSPRVGVSQLGSILPTDAAQRQVLYKIDVDGPEVEVLESSPALVAAQGSRWVIETHSAIAEGRCLELLQSAGFKTRVIRNAWWRTILPEHRIVEHNRWLAAWR